MREKINTNLERMRELIEQLTEADIAYYKNDAPIMTDLEYDRLTEELASLEHDTGLVLSDSPTQKVSGEILESLAEVRHTKPMLSAGKTKSIEDLIRFAAGRAVLLSWKMDGLTLVLRYEYGKLKQAITRGREGIIGEDVTHTVRTFRNVPLTIPTKESFEVRGEGVISWENFRRINASLEEPYTHPRNLASGSTRKLDAGEASKRRLEFWAFELVSDHLEPESKFAQQQFLQRSGFSVVPYIFLDAGHSGQDIRDTVADMEPKDFAYPVDGLVMEYEDLRYGKSLGATGHHENRLIALKWADELYSTRFRGVELATTRTGMVSITGLFDPISIDGTLVSRAYLHNLDIFDEFQFGIGDEISVYKANMIIPQIADNKTQSNTYMLPMTCPCCGKPLTVKYTSGGTRQLYCGNPHCAAKLVQKFAHFCEKTRMNIEGLSAQRWRSSSVTAGCEISETYTSWSNTVRILYAPRVSASDPLTDCRRQLKRAAAARWQSLSPVSVSRWSGAMQAGIWIAISMAHGLSLRRQFSTASISHNCRILARPCTTTFIPGMRMLRKQSSGVRC